LAPGRAKVEVVVTDKANREFRLLVAETAPVENHFGKYVDGRLRWADNGRISLSVAAGEVLDFDAPES
jgi:hypothetical protein